MTASELKEELTLVNAKIKNILETGTAYTVQGSVSVTNPQLIELRKHRDELETRLLQFAGYTSRTSPDFSE